MNPRGPRASDAGAGAARSRAVAVAELAFLEETVGGVAQVDAGVGPILERRIVDHDVALRDRRRDASARARDALDVAIRQKWISTWLARTSMQPIPAAPVSGLGRK